MTTIPERFASDWFADNARDTMTTMRGKFVWWCNVPPTFEATGEPYVVSRKVRQLLREFPNFRLFRTSRDEGPITKILGPLINPEIPLDAPLLICDDDWKYNNEIVRLAAAHMSRDPTRVYTFCGMGVMGFRGFVVTKLQCLGIPINIPTTCRRIDDDLLDMYFKGKTVPITYLGSRSNGCTIENWDDAVLKGPGELQTALRHDNRAPLVKECTRDFYASFGSLADVVVPHNFRPRIAVCMWYNDGIKEYADLTRRLNQQYCDKYGHTLIFDSVDRIPSTVKAGLSVFAQYAWQRMPQLVEVMNSDQYDWVVWVDADAAFRPSPGGDKLRKLVFSHRDLDAVFSADHPRNPLLNSGVMLFQNTPFTRQLLDYYNLGAAPSADEHACFVRGKQFLFPGEQGCVRHSYADNVLDLQKHSVIVPYGVIQTFALDDSEYPNSMILHASGISTAERVRCFKKMTSVL